MMWIYDKYRDDDDIIHKCGAGREKNRARSPRLAHLVKECYFSCRHPPVTHIRLCTVYDWWWYSRTSFIMI